ncbi:MAG TPA: pentapeptide repeat-containing protein [Geobacteraceae bacterium]
MAEQSSRRGFIRLVDRLAAVALATTLFSLPVPHCAQSAGMTEKAEVLSPLPPPEAKRAMASRVGGAEAPYSCPFCNLAGTDLSGKDLTNANLAGADLSGANLKGAVMDGVILIGADLSDANLQNARLNDSAKGPANLSRTNLTGASLSGATMDGTDLQFAELGGTDFTGADLRKVKFGPRIKAKTSKGRKTSFRHATLRREFAVDEKVMDVTGVKWFEEKSDAAPGNGNIACGNADLSGLTSRIYVSTGGADNDSCGATQDAPCKSIAYGIGRCGGPGCGVLVSYDEYAPAATIALRDGVNVYGGCLPQDQAKPEYFSVITAPAGGLPAVSATGINSGALLQGFQVNASAAGGTNGAVSMAMLATDSSRLSVVNAQLVANSAGQGAAGAYGADGQRGGDANGRDGGTNGGCGSTGGGKGACQMDISVDVHFASVDCNPSCSENSCWGYNGSPGTTGNWPHGGQWGNGNCAECPVSRGDTGHYGDGGTNAGCGNKGYASADKAGRFGGATWVGGTGGAGTGGGNGGGGGGGGAGGYKAGACFWVPTADKGNSGGGGGAGGCTASGGGGGRQGGASFAMVAVNSSVIVRGSDVIAGKGGAGGKGGNGARGGAGGKGAGGAGNQPGGYGGNGGAGGAGGASGGGAGGNGGPAVGIALVGGSAISGEPIVYYAGASGVPGDKGQGGGAVVSGACTGPDGDTGVSGLVADTYPY